MLEAKNLFKKYGDFSVVGGVSLQVGRGEMVSVVGPSGAGKSTLLHLLGGLDKADSGSILIDGTDMLALPPRKQAKFRNAKIGFVFQFHHLLPEFSALENVCVPLWIKGESKKAAFKTATEILETVGLGGRLHHKPSELSGGEQQRVAIARALVNRPAVVFADEPTGNLDTANAHAVHQLFLDLRAALGCTLVLVTHNDALSLLTDRTLIMKDGKIVEERLNQLQQDNANH